MLKKEKKRDSRDKRYYLKNRKKIIETSKNYYKNNKIKVEEKRLIRINKMKKAGTYTDYVNKHRVSAKNSSYSYDIVINRHLMSKYGITLKDKKQMLENQSFKCNICQKNIDIKTGFVDHCHETKKVRGLLCHSCNIMLGFSKDNSLNLLRGALYLLKNQTPLQPEH